MALWVPGVCCQEKNPQNKTTKKKTDLRPPHCLNLQRVLNIDPASSLSTICGSWSEQLVGDQDSVSDSDALRDAQMSSSENRSAGLHSEWNPSEKQPHKGLV